MKGVPNAVSLLACSLRLGPKWRQDHIHADPAMKQVPACWGLHQLQAILVLHMILDAYNCQALPPWAPISSWCRHQMSAEGPYRKNREHRRDYAPSHWWWFILILNGYWSDIVSVIAWTVRTNGNYMLVQDSQWSWIIQITDYVYLYGAGRHAL